MLAVVVSTYNEAENLPQLVPQLAGALSGYEYRLIVVDDSSPDGTTDVALQLAND